MKISVLGTGRWASTLIKIAVDGGHQVKCWDRFETDFMKTKKNIHVDLTGNENVTCCADLAETLAFTDKYVIISILSQQFNNLMQEISKIPGYENKIYILAMKGVEAETGRTNSEIAMSYDVDSDNIAVFAGPGQPNSIVENKKINKMVVAAYNKRVAKEIASIIKTENFQLYPWPDVLGSELCGAFKNVYSVLGGMCEAAGHATLKGHIMSVSIYEAQKYLKGMGCNPDTVTYLPLLADYNATLYDPVSHNLNYGLEVVKQNTINPKLDFVSVESKEAVNGLYKRMIERNKRLSDHMQMKAPLLKTYKDLMAEKIKIEKAIPEINKAIDSSLQDWADKSFNL